MTCYIKGIRTSSGKVAQIDYDSLVNKPEEKYTTDEKTKLNGIEDEANKTVIVDNLTTDDGVSALSARQGKALNDNKVPNTRTVNGKALSGDISLNASDVGADASGTAAGVQNNLNAHTSNTNNPHGVSLGTFGVTAEAWHLNQTSGITGNIQSQLNNKSDSWHTHDYAPSYHTHDYAPKYSSIGLQQSSFTLNSSMIGTFIRIHVSSDITVTVPYDDSIPVGAEIEFENETGKVITYSSSNVRLLAASGINTQALKQSDHFSVVAAKKIANDLWVFSGPVYT